ncbi:MAG: type II toxin-antitoxin system PemK/MazF family toxin [Chloroflexi bacterium]|nr:type II toxin-antitoxin system PemK/MazF family toxin [Chloroflexota bacterium]
MTLPRPSRGDVWYADVPTDKQRPVLVLTRDPMGRILEQVICAPITRQVRGLSTEVQIGPEAGLPHPSVVNLDNTMLIHRGHLVRRIGQASAATMEAACEALAIAVDCHWRSPAA